MFWRFGGYANISTIDTILDKADFGLEELLDENDLVQEIKQHNSKLIEYLRQDHILERLLDYVVAPKLAAVGVTAPECEPTEEEDREKERERTSRNRMLPFSRPRAASKPAETDEEEQEKKRNRYAYISAEVLASDTWSIYEALLESPYLIRNFWKFLQRDTPLDPLQASYFTKVNEALFEKKTHDMTQLFMSIPGSVQHLLRHVECPMIMDLLLKIVSMDRNEGGQGIVEWLYHEQLMPGLIAYLSPKNDWVVQTSACEIIKAIITISANASQNEQTCIGPNELTRQLVSRSCVEEMIGYMLSGGNALTTGVSIVIEVIRKNNSDYDPDVCADASGRPSSRDPIYLGTLLRLFAENVPNFMALMANVPAQHVRLDSTFGHKIEPLGVDRFKTCELMAELLHCSNMGLLNELGAEEMVGVRDAERQRLRAEGKLPHHRGGDEVAPAAEDMTLRSSHSPEEGRRLEVTNIADDDGFEEVEHSREMNEDTSHEFVKAEEDIPALPASSLLDKDDDDFVDEPLNSPQMQPKTEGSNVPQFEMPELVVAPLSPKKRVVQDVSDGGEEASSKSGGTEDEKATLKEDSADVARAQTPELSLEKLVDGKLEIKDSKSPEPAHTQEAESEKTAASADVSDSPPEGAAKDGEQSSNGVETSADKPAAAAPESVPASTTDSPATQVDTTIRPHPEDMPAPLFSPQKSNPAEAHPQPLGSEDDSVDLPEYSAAGVGQDDSGMPDSSTFITNDTLQPVSEEPARQQDALQQVGPVVGDLLKSQFVTHDVVPTILSFFFRYPWNNFLHNVVYDIIQQVFNGPMDRGYNPMLAISLFDDAANITASIVKGQAASDEHQVKMKTRLGYMGHLTLIAEEVVKFTERHPPEMLSDTVMDKVMSVEWINYVEGSLADTRERDNAILGGVRPDVAMNNRMSMTGNTLSSVSLGSNTGSNALAEAGLNGAIELNDNGSGGIGPFAISSGALISGFGSSSDEEDEDNEENEEDVNNEFRAYTDPSSSLLTPPSVPPPPPPAAPLNVPPSRARLQLSAQLAKRKKKNEAAAAAAVAAAAEANEDDSGDLSTGASGLGEAGASTDPFADDEEVDEIDSDDDEDGAGIGGQMWGASDRGSWWREVVKRRRPGDDDGGDNSDDEDEDEEFGEFAMPEVDTVARGTPSDSSKLFKPLAVHPPPQSSSPGGSKSAFGGIWPFSSPGTPPLGAAADKDITDEAAGSQDSSAADKHKQTTVSASPVQQSPPPPRSEDGREVDSVVEAKRRTSIEEPDDEDTVTV